MRIFCALLLLPIQDLDRAKSDEALRDQLTTSIHLYMRYTGEWPRSLDDLTRGYWRGKIPDGAAWKDGTLTVGKTKTVFSPPTRMAIVPPTDRLRKVYEARIGIELAKAECQAHRRIHGKFPDKLSDEWKDPWGQPFEFTVKRKGIRISVKQERWILLKDLTAEETRALAEAAEPHWTGEERREIDRRLAELVDDDYETREGAIRALRRIGLATGRYVREKLAKATGTDRQFLEDAAEQFPDGPPAWQTELAPLTGVLLETPGRDADRLCMNNLSQLMKMQWNYLVQYGGARKRFCSETGAEFWLKLSKPPTVLIDDTLKEIYLCPYSLEDDGCSYRGPSEDMNDYGDADPVGMCDGEEHGGCVVILRKWGDVQLIPRGDPLHEQALKKTKR